MLHVDIPTRADIERLIAVRSPACVSIYVPTTPVTPHGEKSRIELKNQCVAAVGQLRDKGVDKRLILEVEESIGDLIEDDEFWRFQANSLAVLATPERTITFRLPTRVGPALEVSDRLHIKPLLRAVAVPQTAYVLALALGSVRLVEVSAELPAQTVKVEGMPAVRPARWAGRRWSSVARWGACRVLKPRTSGCGSTHARSITHCATSWPGARYR